MTLSLSDPLVRLSAMGLVSRASPVQTAVRNCTRDEGGPFGFGDQVADPKPPQAAVVKSHGGERCGNAGTMIPAGTVERGERKRTVDEVSKADQMMSKPGADPCMGLLWSRGSAVQRMFLSFVSFFVRSESPFLRPDPQQRQAVARRSCQGWSLHQPFDMLRPCQAIP
jgi:hypothetical protein